jgi:hypothetical protein
LYIPTFNRVRILNRWVCKYIFCETINYVWRRIHTIVEVTAEIYHMPKVVRHEAES